MLIAGIATTQAVISVRSIKESERVTFQCKKGMALFYIFNVQFFKRVAIFEVSGYPIQVVSEKINNYCPKTVYYK